MEDIRAQYHEQLDRFRADSVQMSAHVIDGIGQVSEALLRVDVAAADQIVTADDELDLMAIEAEERLISTLALQAPVAVDLRLILVALRMVSEIERSGDLVTNIAKGIGRIQGVELWPEIRGYIGDMREEAQRLFRHAIDAYVEDDSGLARALPDLDDRLDDIHRAYLDALFRHFGTGTMTPQQGFQLAVIGRYYERIGDHAVNIAERVVYLVTGEMPEHEGAQRARARRRAAEE